VEPRRTVTVPVCGGWELQTWPSRASGLGEPAAQHQVLTVAQWLQAWIAFIAHPEPNHDLKAVNLRAALHCRNRRYRATAIGFLIVGLTTGRLRGGCRTAAARRRDSFGSMASRRERPQSGTWQFGCNWPNPAVRECPVLRLPEPGTHGSSSVRPGINMCPPLADRSAETHEYHITEQTRGAPEKTPVDLSTDPRSSGRSAPARTHEAAEHRHRPRDRGR
jgi:hypothetical protein